MYPRVVGLMPLLTQDKRLKELEAGRGVQGFGRAAGGSRMVGLRLEVVRPKKSRKWFCCKAAGHRHSEKGLRSVQEALWTGFCVYIYIYIGMDTYGRCRARKT